MRHNSNQSHYEQFISLLRILTKTIFHPVLRNTNQYVYLVAHVCRDFKFPHSQAPLKIFFGESAVSSAMLSGPMWTTHRHDGY